MTASVETVGTHEDKERSDKEPRAWQWPAIWFKDQSFWRDVASRTMSGIFAVIAIGFLGIAFGYLGAPKLVGPTIFYIGFALYVVVMLTIPFAGRIHKHPWLWRSFSVIAVLALVLFVVGGVYMMAANDWVVPPCDPNDDPLFGALC
ncbi:hypothetical protein AR689_07530 [Arthrobacter sp. EpRS71]|nr:hypothetical protein AR689_07530 [Arthrobacter sp. EpRS71]